MLREFTYPDITVVTDRDTIYSFLSARAHKNPDGPLAAYLKGKNRDWEYVTAAQMLDAVQKTARGLIALGVKKADTVLIYAPTSYQWGVVDFACAAVGAVSVPVYDTDSSGQVENIVS